MKHVWIEYLPHYILALEKDILDICRLVRLKYITDLFEWWWKTKEYKIKWVFFNLEVSINKFSRNKICPVSCMCAESLYHCKIPIWQPRSWWRQRPAKTEYFQLFCEQMWIQLLCFWIYEKKTLTSSNLDAKHWKNIWISNTLIDFIH